MTTTMSRRLRACAWELSPGFRGQHFRRASTRHSFRRLGRGTRVRYPRAESAFPGPERRRLIATVDALTLAVCDSSADLLRCKDSVRPCTFLVRASKSRMRPRKHFMDARTSGLRRRMNPVRRFIPSVRPRTSDLIASKSDLLLRKSALPRRISDLPGRKFYLRRRIRDLRACTQWVQRRSNGLRGRLFRMCRRTDLDRDSTFRGLVSRPIR